MSYWSRSFRGSAECLSEVRRFTAAVLGDRPGVDLVVLAASELAGNAILHTASGDPGGQFVVHIAAFADRWQVRVDDAGGPDHPRVHENGCAELCDLAEAGRGLAMVAAVSRAWGVLGDKYSRAVWAEIPHPRPASAAHSGAAATGGVPPSRSSAETVVKRHRAEDSMTDEAAARRIIRQLLLERVETMADDSGRQPTEGIDGIDVVNTEVISLLITPGRVNADVR